MEDKVTKRAANSVIALIQYAHPDKYPPTYNQANLLAARGCKVILIYRGTGVPELDYHENVEHVPVASATGSMASSAATFLRFILKAYTACLQHGVGLAIGYDMHGFMAAYICAKWRRNAFPVVYHNHDIMEMSHLGVMGRYVKKFELAHARFANALVLPNEGRLAYFRENSQVLFEPVIVRNFAPLSYAAPRPRPAGLPQRYALYQGAIGAGHSMEEIIESIPVWSADLDLVLIGPIKEEYKEKLRCKANEIGVSKRVFILPPVSYSELPAYTQHAECGFALLKDQYINQRSCATCSNKIFEYISCGVPVLVNDWPEFKEFFADKAWALFADPFDVSSIAEAVQSISGQASFRKKMAAQARADFKDLYNYEKEFEKLEEMLLSLLRENTDGR